MNLKYLNKMLGLNENSWNIEQKKWWEQEWKKLTQKLK